jgi:small subunit ribosomal protein S9
MEKFYATGRRKTATARVWLNAGSGKLIINGQDVDGWLGGHQTMKKKVKQPLVATKQETSVDVVVDVSGGGISAQAEAVRHGISRALVAFDGNMRAIIKPEGFLTRDSRKVERKKFGRKKARRSPQFSKR